MVGKLCPLFCQRYPLTFAAPLCHVPGGDATATGLNAVAKLKTYMGLFPVASLNVHRFIPCWRSLEPVSTCLVPIVGPDVLCQLATLTLLDPGSAG